jgi:hypothetical protein
VAVDVLLVTSTASTKIVAIVVRVTEVTTMTTSHDFSKAAARDNASRCDALVSSSAVLCHIAQSLLISDILA